MVFETFSNCSNSALNFSEEMKFNDWASRSSVSNSLTDPSDMYKKRLNSFWDCLAAPSAILVGTDTAARLICEMIPYFSSIGKTAVVV